ncbi:unnamed protein product [Caenorhabditis bovis]|uniref:Uncharacterized protein n=1 Tax=Caenorhabditis bovis TaxID=2654633 RepID=A0A8S1FFF8_9PELO|nr:unnamed protein product [Caenorhabditis bovis]
MTLTDSIIAALTDIRHFFAPLFKSLIELLLQPTEKSVDVKVSLYKTLRLILRAVFENNSAEIAFEAEDWLLDGHATSSSSSDEIVNIVETMAFDIGRHISSNISDLPKHRKATAILLANDLLHEDLKGSKKLAACLSQSGVCRVLCEELLSIEFDWNVIASPSGAAIVTRVEQCAQSHLLTSILTVFTRLASSEQGWTALSELAVTEIIAEMYVFTEPPKEVFLKPETVKIKGTPAYAFANTLDLALHLCKQLCSKAKWKKLTLRILALIQSFGEIFQQLVRAGVACNCLETARAIVYEVSVNDESIIDAIDGDNVLRQLRVSASEGLVSKKPKSAQINANSSFAAPRQLFSTLLPV